ncbi:MAG: hypothetical protein MZV64_63960 [Ignavibacteriales bacterium]|nr:hypothetical protein [Ignavibacteriales bacterium]
MNRSSGPRARPSTSSSPATSASTGPTPSPWTMPTGSCRSPTSAFSGTSGGTSASTACWPPRPTSSAWRRGCPSSSSTISSSRPTTS